MVQAQDGEAFANQIGFEFYQCSTLQGKGVEEPFKALARMLTERYEQRIAEVKDKASWNIIESVETWYTH